MWKKNTFFVVYILKLVFLITMVTQGNFINFVK